MARYGGCRVVVEFDDGRPVHEDDDSDVHLDERGDGEMLVSWWDDQGPVVLAGSGDGDGRFVLTGRSRPQRATLRRQGRRVFAGSWSEGGAGGTLRVEIPDGAAPSDAGEET